MYIEKRYSSHREESAKYFCIKIVVKETGNNNPNQCFVKNTENLVDPRTSYITIENLNNEKFLKEHDIEYIIEENKETKEKAIIPIGLFEFHYSNYSELLLWHIGDKDLYKVEDIIKNIEKAIQIKYKALKFTNRCNQIFVEQLELH